MVCLPIGWLANGFLTSNAEQGMYVMACASDKIRHRLPMNEDDVVCRHDFHDMLQPQGRVSIGLAVYSSI